MRSLGVPVSHYLDDRHVFLHCGLAGALSSLERAQAATYIMLYLLIEAGYFIGIEKSQLVPSTWIRFLGFIYDSVRQAFLIPEDKKVKFAALREDILSSPFVGLIYSSVFQGRSCLSALPFQEVNCMYVVYSRRPVFQGLLSLQSR